MLRQSVGSIPPMSPVVSHEMEEFLLSTPINPNNFPAKLWRIVNSPRYRSIRWDPRGEGLIVDQQLFESELLTPIKNVNNGANLEPDTDLLFKTTNFTSFIRQLNLYGFRKMGQGSGEHPVPGELGAGDGLLHHFHNPSFKQDHPELLINMKRLTSANKAKLAAGLQVNTRPPNRFQRYLTNSMDSIGQNKGDRHGPVTVGQLQRTFRRDNLSPYPFISSTHNQSPLHTVSIKNLSGSNPGGLDRTPIPPRTWHSSIGLVAGQIDTTSSSPFSDKAIPFSVIQRFPTEVTYTLQPNPNNVHVQQGSQEIGSAGQKYTSYLTSPSQYHQAFYPTAVLQCCPPNSHLDPMTGCPNTNTSSYPNYNYYQNAAMQSSYPVDVLHNNAAAWHCTATDESKKSEVNLETVFQIVDELRASPKIQLVKMDTTENSSPMQQSRNTLQTSSTPTFTDNAGANVQAMKIQSLTSAVSEIKSFVVAATADQSLSCSLPVVADSVHTATSQPSENTTIVSIVPESVPPDQCLPRGKVSKLCHNASLHPIVFVEDGPESSTERTVHGTDYQTGSLDSIQTTDRSRTIISALLSDFDIPKATVAANTTASTPIKSRRQNSSQQAKSPDLHLLVDVACNQDHFQKDEDICVWETEASHSPQLSP
ncbi:heat shock factor protein 5 [Leucoraja erinacea]|uniref:heat shock factor protein 5 n=1 Tax=Leucoraja erinaceus TaxID=7782 RepID=UPI002456CA7B|nr:heat shock factor protein 5 [Leucoraja erinacea]